MNNCPSCDSALSTPHPYTPTYAEIVTCQTCQLIYRRDRPDPAWLHDLYQRYADSPSHMHLPGTFDEVRTTGLRRPAFMAEVTSRQPPIPTSRFLDIGCGWGAFLLHARELGYTPEGVELTQPAIDFGRSMLGLPIHSGQLESQPIVPGLSVITLIHTLEHLPSISTALSYLHSHLLPTGLLAGIVPNIGSLAAQHLGPAWGWLDPNFHYTHFTPATLTSTLTRHGFTQIELSTRSGDYDPAVVATASFALGHPPSPLEGEEIWFFARRA